MYQRIAILFAVEQERAPLLRYLPLPNPRPDLRDRRIFWISEVDGRHVLLLAGGVGHRKAEEAARRIVEHWVPDLMIMAGVAGALAPEAAVGDVVLADRIVTPSGELIPNLVPVPGETTARSVRTGALLCADRVLVTAAEKKAAYSPNAQRPMPNAPLAVEMETAGLAHVAMEHRIPWAAVRAISDSADESLPLDFNRLRSADGDLPTSRVALAAITHPWAIPGLIRLGKNTTEAADALAGFLHTWIQRGLPTR